MDRLTVKDFYQIAQHRCAIDIPELDRAYFVQEWLFVISKDAPNNLIQYSLKNQTRLANISLPFPELQGLQIVKNKVCLIFKNQEDLWIYDSGSMIRYQSHFAPITVITSHHNRLISGSADMTIRLWNIMQQGLEHDTTKHIISGHKGTVTCFLSHQNLLLSGSTDRYLMVWKATSLICHRQFSEGLIFINECAESYQIAVYDRSGQVSIISSLVLQKVIVQIGNEPINHINEIDDSFIQIINKKSIQIAEINIGQGMAKIDLSQLGEIVSTRCLRRMTLLCIRNRGLFTIKF